MSYKKYTEVNIFAGNPFTSILSEFDLLTFTISLYRPPRNDAEKA